LEAAGAAVKDKKYTVYGSSRRNPSGDVPLN
jgi:hypothetical protein